MDYFNYTLTELGKTYFIIACIGSVLFLGFMLLAFLGGDTEADTPDVDMEIDGDGGIGFQFLSIRNMLAFFTIFGWTGVLCTRYGMSTITTVILSTLAGLMMMFIIASLFYYMGKLASSGTLDVRKAVGSIGEVYLPVGGKKTTIGQIQIKVQGTLVTLDAITQDDNDLPTGTVVKVKSIVSDELLLIEKLSDL